MSPTTATQGQSQHLFHYEPTFVPEEGVALPVAHRGRPLVTRNLKKAYQLILGCIDRFSRVLVARFILKPPIDPTLREDITSSDLLIRFLLAIKSRIRLDAEATGLSHHTAVFHMASREYGHHQHPPYFHIVLMLDGDLYPSAGPQGKEDSSLLAQIIETWATVIKVAAHEAKAYVMYSPGKPGMYLHRLEPDDGYLRLADAFEQASYLCKAKGRQPGQRYRGLIMSTPPKRKENLTPTQDSEHQKEKDDAPIPSHSETS